MPKKKVPQNREDTRNDDGTFKPGVSGNPGGRPKNSLKNYLSRIFNEMSDEQKAAWLNENKIPALDQWKMAEGNPSNEHSGPDGGPIEVRGVEVAVRK